MAHLSEAIVRAAGEQLAVELPRAAGVGLKPGAALACVGHGDAIVLLRPAFAEKGYFAGDLAVLTLGEVLGHVVSGLRTGRLVVTRGAVRRTLSFRDGQLVFATSTDPLERLGRVLVRRGLISARQLEDALPKVSGGAKLGQLLQKAGAITVAQLYAAMTDLVKEIAVGLFEHADGQFVFLEGASPGDDSVKLRERTRDVLLEGVKRAEQVQRLRTRFPPLMRVKRGPRPLPPEASELEALVAGGAELMTLQSNFEGSDFAFLTLVERMLADGALVKAGEPLAPRPPAGRPGRSALELYDALVRALVTALTSAGHPLDDLRSFLTDPLPGMEEAFAGVGLTEDGRLDVGRVLANLEGKGNKAVARAQAYEALDGFVSYALFSTRNVLPQERSEALTAEFRRLQEGLDS